MTFIISSFLQYKILNARCLHKKADTLEKEMDWFDNHDSIFIARSLLSVISRHVY